MELTIAGIVLVGTAIIGGSMILSAKITASAQVRKDEIKEYFAKNINDSSREAESWRLAYEELRKENETLRSRLKVQNLVYGKVKLKEMSR